MANPERKSGLERITNIVKKIDIGSAIAGLIIGGDIGLAIVLWSGVTYVAADMLEKGGWKRRARKETL